MNSLPFFIGDVILKSHLSLEQVGEILSDRLFGGLKFGGKEKYIHEEIPAIFIQQPILGLIIVLDEGPCDGNLNAFDLSVSPISFSPEIKTEHYRLDAYLHELLKISLVNHPEIIIVEPESGNYGQ